MPSRRSMLVGCGTAAGLAALGGCSIGSSEGSSAAIAQRDLQPEAASVVARIQAEVADCRQGAVVLRAVGYDSDTRPGEIGIWTRTRVYPGRNLRDCESDWVQQGIDMGHDWSDLQPDTEASVFWDSNIVYTDEPSPGYTLQNTSSRRHARWEIRTQGNAAESNTTYEFRSTLRPIEGVGDGDDLADITLHAPMSSSSLFGDSKTLSLSRTLTYGETEK